MDTKSLDQGGVPWSNFQSRAGKTVRLDTDERMLASAKLLGISRHQFVKDAINFYINSKEFQKKLSTMTDLLKGKL